MKKKLLLIVSMLAVLVCLLAISVSAANVVVDGVHYTTYSASYEGYDGRAAVNTENRTATTLIVEIPDFIETEDGKRYVVDEIKNDAFYGNTTMTELRILSKYITKIPASMIASTYTTGALKKIYIDFSNITSIGSAGLNPSNQTNGNSPQANSFYYYDAKTFIESGEDKVITCPDFSNCTSIGSAAFQGANFEKLIIPAAVAINGQVFRKTTITELVIEGENRQTMGLYAFNDCVNLKKITVKSRNLTSIYNDVFSANYNLEEIYIDLSKCTYIGSSTFIFSTAYDHGCDDTQWYNLEGEKIVDLSSLKKIEDQAFASSNLGSAKIIWPKALDSMGSQVFRKCNINQPLYLNASEGKTISVEYWALNGNSFPLVVLGTGVTTFNARLEVQSTLVSLADSLQLGDGEVFNVSGSQFYGKAFTGTDISSKSKVTVNKISSGVATYYGACGIDCNVTLASDSSNVVISVPVHTWDDGIVDETKCPIGAVLNFDCNYCDAKKTEGEGTDHSHTVAIIVYGDNNFFAKGTKTYKCANEECTSKLAEGTEVSPIFTSLGYSKTEVGTKAVRQGFAIDQDALKEYNNSTDNKIIGFGVLAASKKALNGETEVFENGALNNTKVAYVDFGTRNFDIMEIKISGLEGGDETNGDYVELELYCCGYYLVQNNTSVDSYYASEGTVTESLSATVTFNSVK